MAANCVTVGFCRNLAIGSEASIADSMRFLSSNEVSESRPSSASGRSASIDDGGVFSTAPICWRRKSPINAGRPAAGSCSQRERRDSGAAWLRAPVDRSSAR